MIADASPAPSPSQAAAGAIIPEGLAANGADIKGATWFETGAAMLNGGTLNWFAVPWGIIDNPLPLFAVVAINAALLTAVENYRRTGEGPAGYSPGVGKFDSSIFDGLDSLYPGGPFDPLGLADDPEVFEELKVRHGTGLKGVCVVGVGGGGGRQRGLADSLLAAAGLMPQRCGAAGKRGELKSWLAGIWKWTVRALNAFWLI
jgi:hypothetical protein